MKEEAALDRVVASIRASRKYAGLAPEIVRRAAAEALRGGADEWEAARRARRKLHQAYGAFGVRVDYRRIEALVEELESRPTELREALLQAARAVSPRILGMHASTAERLDGLEDFYRAAVGPDAPASIRVLDLGCGLGPFALPWMGLGPRAEYCAVDADVRLAGLARRYLAALGQSGTALAADLLAGELPPGPWDVALLLKLLPTLERQERGAAARLVRTVEAARIVLSFPRASLGGRRKGMDEQYERFATDLAEECGLEATRCVFPRETVYVCRPPRR